MSDAPTIRVLSDHVANKIAAGEVVERPASVFKELVENSIDAGATQIDVEVIMGGRKSVIVSDNGSGMTPDEALLCLERHATSKIRDVDDIEEVSTLGFRGEAIPSIASVSRFTLTTRKHDALSGTEILISGGKILEVNEAGCPPGTSVAVRNLFFNVPARRKFLKAEQTELTNIRQTFLVTALAHPEVGLKLVSDDREIYNLPPAISLEERVADVFDSSLLDQLCPVNLENLGVHISGYIGLPQFARNDRRDQYIFVNRRPASAALVHYAINQGYQGTLAKNKYPVLFLFIDVEPGMVDVNVHPAKREVRFRQGHTVRDTVINALQKALNPDSRGPGSSPLHPGGVTSPSEPSTAAPFPTPAAVPVPQSRSQTRFDLPGSRSRNTFDYPRMPLPSQELIDEPPPDAPPSEPLPEGSPWAWCRVISRIGELFVLLETEDGLVIMDPQAAHERVMFDRMLRKVRDQVALSQALLHPETVSLGPREALAVRKNQESFEIMGFSISDFGGDTFIIDAIPAALGDITAGSILGDIATSLESGGKQAAGEWVREQIAKTAVHACVRARDELSRPEIDQLVQDLARTDMPYTCPHGRPTLIFMGFNELKKKFGRT
ncbi:MAG: DNA mismatch repair protein MutL [Candidatus Omnitrophota bacterium]